MSKKTLLALLALVFALTMNAQTALPKVYDEDVNPIEQIDQAVMKAKSEGKFVICRLHQEGQRHQQCHRRELCLHPCELQSQEVGGRGKDSVGQEDAEAS